MSTHSAQTSELRRSHLPTSPTLSSSHATHRTSVSIQPDEDPFSPFTMYATDREEGNEEEAEGEDDWMRISEDSIGLGFGQGGEEPEEGRAGRNEREEEEPVRVVKRKPSFLRALWDTRLSRSSSAASLRSLKSKISNPILHTEPPRIAPLRPRASLISFSEATSTFNVHRPVQEEEEVAEASQEQGATQDTIDLDRLSPLPFGSSYPSGTQSLRLRPVSRRSSLLRPHDVFSRTVGPSSSRCSNSRPLVRATSFDAGDLPPTDSAKAFSVLVGPKVTEENQKAVERLTGFRSSYYKVEQELGVALTTDAPTRYVLPDNRISLASSSNDNPSSSSTTTNTQTPDTTATDPSRCLSMASEFRQSKFNVQEEIPCRSSAATETRKGRRFSTTSLGRGMRDSLDLLLLGKSKTSGSNRFPRSKGIRKPVEIVENTSLQLVRRPPDDFVERRETLDARLSQLDRKMDTLLATSQDWKETLGVFRTRMSLVSAKQLRATERNREERGGEKGRERASEEAKGKRGKRGRGTRKGYTREQTRILGWWEGF